MDAYDHAHLEAWLARRVPAAEYEQTLARIRFYLGRKPSAIAEGMSWPEMAEAGRVIMEREQREWDEAAGPRCLDCGRRRSHHILASVRARCAAGMNYGRYT